MARRSVMFTPGDRPEMLRKAPDAGADVVVFDLEDAVAPGRKDEARDAVREVLADPAFAPDCELCLRVNPTGSGAADDVAAVLDGDSAASDPTVDDSAGDGTTIDSVMLPKASSADDVATLAGLLGDDVPVLALVETAAGVLNAAEIAAAAATDAVAFGAEDLAADVGATRTEEGTEVLYAREHVVLAASAADVDAIDTVFTDIEDAEGLAAETEFAIELGYDGKMAIHPSQVAVVNDAFTPSDEQIAWARRVLDARDAAAADERGVFRVDGEMIDAPLVAQAERVMDRARAAGEVDG